MNSPSWKTVVCAGLLLACAARADAKTARMCDVTGDGTISALDATYVLQFVAGMRDLTPEQQLLADATGNGRVTAFDAMRILQASTGQIVPGSLCGKRMRMH
jgi:hypothetical protein